MQIINDKVVSVHYELRTTKGGEVVEKTEKENPLTFLFGHKNMLPKFEDNLKDLKKGDKFDFMLKAEEGYGKFNQDMVIDIPAKTLSPDGKIDKTQIFVGKTLAMQDNKGNKFNGLVKEVGEDKVKMDFNHPMADKDLFFSGEIATIRDADANELKQGHPGHECTGCGKH